MNLPPGRSCPLHYRYAPSDFARTPGLVADTLYVVGGLYGNRAALDALLALAAEEGGPATLVFNGDFNWFNIDAEGFAAVNREVLRHVALRYDAARRRNEFLANRPPGSPVHESYYRRIAAGPAYGMADAVRLGASLSA